MKRIADFDAFAKHITETNHRNFLTVIDAPNAPKERREWTHEGQNTVLTLSANPFGSLLGGFAPEQFWHGKVYCRECA